MQNTKPPSNAPVTTSLSVLSGASVLDRVIAVAAAPLLAGEKEADYASIAARIVNASAPRDSIEEFLVRDIVDLTWEILRLRRVKAGILRASKKDGVRGVLAGVGYSVYERDTLSDSWAAGDETARKKVDAISLRPD